MGSFGEVFFWKVFGEGLSSVFEGLLGRSLGKGLWEGLLLFLGKVFCFLGKVFCFLGKVFFCFLGKVFCFLGKVFGECLWEGLREGLLMVFWKVFLWSSYGLLEGLLMVLGKVFSSFVSYIVLTLQG